MEIWRATDDSLAVAHANHFDSAPVRNTETSPIISTKEARKLLGKEISGTLSDMDLMETIRLMSHLANNLLEEINVPQNYMAGV